MYQWHRCRLGFVYWQERRNELNITGRAGNERPENGRAEGRPENGRAEERPENAVTTLPSVYMDIVKDAPMA